MSEDDGKGPVRSEDRGEGNEIILEAFFITTPLFVLFLTIFDIWMIQTTFTQSLNQQVNQCMTQNRAFQNSYELTFYSLSESQREQTTLKRMVETFCQKQSQEDYGARIFDADGSLLYEGGRFHAPNMIREKLTDEENVGYELVRDNGHIYVVVMCRSSIGTYIETSQDITDIFVERGEMYSRYQIGMIAMTCLVGGLILLVLFLMMRNMQKLSRAARQFARGRYTTRVRIRSGDEIGMLAEDFNWMADAMNRQMVQLEGEVRRQEEFTSAFAHELKTPLTSIIGYADTIRQMELTPEETDMCADYIFQQGKRLQSLSYKLLEMTMAGNREISARPVRTQDLFDKVGQAVSVSLLEKSLTLEKDLEPGVIYGDEDLLSSVFINLIDNARKASAPGAAIWLSGREVPEGYCTVVEDEAGGLPQEEIERITEAFYMVDKSRARKEGGAGLGLALCKKIIDLHQGSWKIETVPGRGLRVTVILASAKTRRRERKGRLPKKRGQARRTGTKKKGEKDE